MECGLSYQMVNVRSLIDDVLNPDRRRAEKPRMPELPVMLRQQVVNFLTSLPNMHGQQTFQALLYAAGIDAKLELQLDFGLPSAQFFPLLIKTLSAYGILEDGRHPLIAILNATENLGGQQHRITCTRLIEEITEGL